MEMRHMLLVVLVQLALYSATVDGLECSKCDGCGKEWKKPSTCVSASDNHCYIKVERLDGNLFVNRGCSPGTYSCTSKDCVYWQCQGEACNNVDPATVPELKEIYGSSATFTPNLLAISLGLAALFAGKRLFY